ncbi:DUF4178 domain-containing protein [Paracoccus saliphilus]|uniref:DUF4178 domain-containing protein n=1 Tax=Paracoccus saliphilus TaxID=405559 RepID=A0AA45W0P2_9RHOB|nr:DUF4178 domain-containing protein [Paracoccus saliphilus]SIS50402.1 protein of unknown function [Paracoccus saliphilus]
MNVTAYNCPNCGARINELAKIARMAACDSCDTALLIEDEVVRATGQKGVMHEATSLFDIGDTVKAGDSSVLLRGKARFSYGRGFWDEFWGLDAVGKPVWISLDEGDVAVQRELVDASLSRAVQNADIGDAITLGRREFVISEIETAECVALRGAFDHELKVGESYEFINALGKNGALLSYEYWIGGAQLYLGQWFSPFDIEVEAAP